MASDDKELPSIRNYMKKVIREYDDVRGKCLADGADLFYDAIVISTSDEEQSKAYQSQIRDKVERKELPVDLPFYLYADPPGVKIGSGGSILYSLRRLHEQLGDTLYKLRVLLICGGGQSQRLPTSSILGKLFQPLPFGQPPYHMLDLKLAMYRPFARTMRPGVLVTCSDDVETFYLAPDAISSGRVSFDKGGFVALGHVSSKEIGLHHGVYVLPENIFGANAPSEVTTSCIQVLQKPTIAQMEDAGAILADGNVCTDSIFFFDHTITAKFVDWIESRSPSCEIDAYGDFLRPLGTRIDNDIITTTTTASKELARARTALNEMLSGTPLHVVLLVHSHFFHLGTMTEFIEHLVATDVVSTSATTPHPSFFDELRCQSVVCSRINGTDHAAFVQQNPRSTLIYSVVDDATVRLGSSTVVEYCHLVGPLTVGAGSILSHCRVSGVDWLPADVCFHTSAIVLDKERDKVRFVTTAFGVRDDMKARGCDLVYLGVSLEIVCKCLRVSIESVFGASDGGEGDEPNLWNARLFSVADTPDEAFRCAARLVRAVLNEETVSGMVDDDVAPALFMSIAQVVRYKHVGEMLGWRRDLRVMIYE